MAAGLSLVACSAPGPQLHVDKAHGFAIEFPAGWRVEPAQAGRNIVKAMLRKSDDTATVIVALLADRLGVADAGAHALYDSGVQANPNIKFTFNGEGTEVINGVRAQWHSYTMEVSPERRLLVYYFPRDTMLFTVTASCHPRRFSRHEEVFRRVAASFRLPPRDSADTDLPSDGAIPRTEEYGFAFSLPNGWTYLASPSADCVLRAVGPEPGVGGIRTALFITATRVDRSMTEQDMQPSVLAKILADKFKGSSAVDYAELAASEVSLQGRKAVRMMCTANHDLRKRQGKRGFVGIVYALLHRGRFLTIEGMYDAERLPASQQELDAAISALVFFD
jgi:hypothetical protein